MVWNVLNNFTIPVKLSDYYQKKIDNFKDFRAENTHTQNDLTDHDKSNDMFLERQSCTSEMGEPRKKLKKKTLETKN